jgi:hypothetical protein
VQDLRLGESHGRDVAADSSANDPIVQRNRTNVKAVLALLRGETVTFPQVDVWDCPRAAPDDADSLPPDRPPSR